MKKFDEQKKCTLNDRWIILIQFSFFFALTFVLFRDYIAENIIALNKDGCGYMNLTYYASECIKQGELPLWNPYMSAGRPFANDISNFAFYPIRILFSALPMLYFFYSFYSFHLAFGAVCFSMYLREIGCDRWVSLAMSFPYYFSICLGGYRKCHVLIIACTVYLPILLYFVEKYYNTRHPRFLWISSLFLSIQFLTGYPQDTLYTDIIVGVYLIVLEVKFKFPLLRWLRDGIVWVLLYFGMILVQLVPFAEMYAVYSVNGSARMNFDQFKTYSVNPIKLLIMLCPKFFSSHPNNSILQIGYSELQAELFMGTVSAVLIIFAILKYRDNYRVKLSLYFMLAIFIYAMNGESVILSKIFYHIPILGSFRCASRILFAFVFFGLVVVAYMLEKTINLSDCKSLLYIFISILSLLVLALGINLSTISYFDSSQTTITDVMERYKNTIAIVVFAIIILYFSQMLGKYKKPFIILSLISLIIVDTYPYWKESATYNMAEFGVDNDIERFLVDHKSEGKVILDNPYLDGNYPSAIETSFALSLKVQGINSYTTFNDPRLSRLFTDDSIVEPSFNCSGLYTGFPDISKNMIYDNDMLSMLGVRYIIDQEGLVPNSQYCFGKELDSSEPCLFQKLITIGINDGLSVMEYPINLQPNTNYMISFCYDGNDVSGEFYIDFYSENYDYAEQQRDFHLVSEKKFYECIIPSGNMDNVNNPVSVRIIASNNEEIEIHDFRVERLEYERIRNPYKLVTESENVKIYENTNCKGLLYVPERVQAINDIDDLYENKSKYDLAEVSYLRDNLTFETANTHIDNVSVNINNVTATIYAEDKTFINFSQANYPGWEAFVDGEKTTIYEVNGYIQGIAVDKGNHYIEFVYRPKSLLYGLLGTLFSVLVWFTLVFVIYNLSKGDKLCLEN